jgi:hypothetical protein
MSQTTVVAGERFYSRGEVDPLDPDYRVTVVEIYASEEDFLAGSPSHIELQEQPDGM